MYPEWAFELLRKHMELKKRIETDSVCDPS